MEPDGQAPEAARDDARVPFDERVEVVSPVRCVGRGLDVGAGGLGLELPVMLDEGSLVAVSTFAGRLIVHGEVRWCRRSQQGFRVGIRFRPEDWGIVQRVQRLQKRREQFGRP